MSNTGYMETLTNKGLKWINRPWSGVSQRGIVLSVWDNLTLEESECRYVDGKDVLRVYPAAWVDTKKGQQYIEHCMQAKDSATPVEVYFVRGVRGDGTRSSVSRCWIDPNRYFVLITRVDQSGLIEGEFLPWTPTS